MADLSSIAGSAMLRGLTDSDLLELGGLASEEAILLGQRLFARGQSADHFFIAREGRLALTLGLRVLGSITEMAVEEVGAGDGFGWSAIVHPHQWVYSVYCIEEGAVFVFPREELQTLMACNEGLAYRLSKNVSQLVARRLRFLQKLWLEEVEQSMTRIEYWTHDEPNAHLRDAIRMAHQFIG